jgi:purine nucleosidase
MIDVGPMTKRSRFCLAFIGVLLASSFGWTQQRRKVIINQDGSGPGGSNMQTLALLIQSPQVEVLGITVVS